jgi:ubiquitin
MLEQMKQIIILLVLGFPVVAQIAGMSKLNVIAVNIIMMLAFIWGLERLSATLKPVVPPVVPPVAATEDTELEPTIRRRILRSEATHGMAPEENLKTMQIFVNTMSGSTFTFQVKPTDTVHSVKLLIEWTEGILVAEHELIFDGKQLQDGMMLCKCGIQDGSDLTLVVFEKISIKVFHDFGDPRDNDYNLMTVYPADTVLDVKKALGLIHRVAAKDIELSFVEGHEYDPEDPDEPIEDYSEIQFIPMHDNCTLESYGIKNLSCIRADSDCSYGHPDDDDEDEDEDNEEGNERGNEEGNEGNDKMQIFVNTLAGRTFTLKVEAGYTIEEVKVKISNKEGIPLYQQQLVLAEQQLEDGMMLWNYGIQDGSELTLLLVESFEIEIKRQEDDSFKLTTMMMMNVRGSDTINDIKAKIHAHEPESRLKCMRLMKSVLEHDEDDHEDYQDDEMLEDGEKTLADYDITKANKRMWIYVDWEGSGDEGEDDA